MVPPAAKRRDSVLVLDRAPEPPGAEEVPLLGRYAGENRDCEHAARAVAYFVREGKRLLRESFGLANPTRFE